MSKPAAYIPKGYRQIAGHFRYVVNGIGNGLVFEWDGAAVGPDGALVLIEAELTRPVPLHIQGHVARASMMVALGESIEKLIWIVPRRHFRMLYSIVEEWRSALVSARLPCPTPCEYWTPEGDCLVVGPDHGYIRHSNRSTLVSAIEISDKGSPNSKREEGSPNAPPR